MLSGLLIAEIYGVMQNQFVLCIENKDCDDLEKRKVYQVIPDESASLDGYLRVIDESGEDYLYPESFFVFVQLPQQGEEVFQVSGQ